MERNIKLYVVRDSILEETEKKYMSIMISQLQLDTIVHALLVKGLVSFDSPYFQNLTPIQVKCIGGDTWKLEVE